MYKTRPLNEDKSNSSNASSSLYSAFTSDKKYHEHGYGVKEHNPASDYLRREEPREKEKNENTLFDEIEDNIQESKAEDMKEEEIPLKAAKELFEENPKQAKKERKDIKTIEDAIKNAIEEEKKAIIMDD